jgi:hypothetical protein
MTKTKIYFLLLANLMLVSCASITGKSQTISTEGQRGFKRDGRLSGRLEAIFLSYVYDIFNYGTIPKENGVTLFQPLQS